MRVKKRSLKVFGKSCSNYGPKWTWACHARNGAILFHLEYAKNGYGGFIAIVDHLNNRWLEYPLYGNVHCKSPNFRRFVRQCQKTARAWLEARDPIYGSHELWFF